MSMGWVLRENLSLLLTMLAVSAPFLIALGVVYYFKYRAAASARGNDSVKVAGDLENLELRRQMKALQKRVEVLEAIVTDEKHELSRKIANL
jgi:F0F1-type ATP synthase membrane subunit b/b'